MMKKLLFLLFAQLTLPSWGVEVEVTYNYTKSSIYDVNHDGKVDPDDMSEILRCWLVDGDWLNPNFDLNSDGQVDIADVYTLQTYLQSNPMNMDITPYIGWGDVNGNGRVNATDYYLIQEFATEYENAKNGWVCNNADYDLNDDGKCDFWDYYIVYLLVEQGYTTPIPLGNIVFKDASTKAACVACFDLNGDGELSYREAARVKASQLQDIAGNSGLAHFDEFQYFTGVTELPEGCFSNNTNLVSITLPSSIKTVSNYAFSNCTSLVSVTLPEGLTSIRDYGFNGCTSLAAINFPSTHTNIGDNAFFNCGNLANIAFAETSSLDHIGRYAFSNCAALTSFNFEKVQHINSHAFANTGLTEVNTRAGNIGKEAFYTSHPITVNLLRDYIQCYTDDNDSHWGLHLPITNPSVSGTKVLVNRAIFSNAYNATTAARDQLHPYIKFRPYNYESDYNEATPFACEVPVVLPMGSKIFIVTGLETGKALARQIPGRVVPANTGVIVKLPGRVLDQTQVWQLTADPTATSDADFSDNILQPAVRAMDVNSGNQCFEWQTLFSDNHCIYGFQANMDAVFVEACYAYLNVPASQLPSGSTPYSYDGFYEMSLTTPELSGDVNGDELTDVTDVNIIINIMLGKAQASSYPGNADVNNSGNVDVSDVNKVINIMLGKEPGGSEPTPEPVEVTYDYTSVASIQALGFAESEISTINPVEDKVLSDQYATMDYYHTFFLQWTDSSYMLSLCSTSESSYYEWDSSMGKVVWNAKSGKKITKVIVQALNSYSANRVEITSNDTGATITKEDALTTCNFSGAGVNNFTISRNATTGALWIKKITVTYQ